MTIRAEVYGAATVDGRRRPEYAIWAEMIQRCHHPANKAFKNYGGRGIVVCESWRRSFVTFIADIGWRPSQAHSLDRIDNDRGYEPGNVRWALSAAQGRNKRNNRFLTLDGRTQTVSAWAEECGLHRETIRQRLAKGWSPERAIKTPARIVATRCEAGNHPPHQADIEPALCAAPGCARPAGRKSGVCGRHYQLRWNKRRFDPDWDFPRPTDISSLIKLVSPHPKESVRT